MRTFFGVWVQDVVLSPVLGIKLLDVVRDCIGY